MAAVDVGARGGPPVPAADDLDDLYNYDIDAAFRDVDTNLDNPPQQQQTTRLDGRDNAAGLGIDEEVKVTKKRAPIAKLDEHRLLSPAGIPKLRRIAKDRLKFRGKGHEYSDVARLLNTYQLWLDELYPRAKFADGLAIIEKLGHSKRMQTMRREWINEGKSTETSGRLEDDRPEKERKKMQEFERDISMTAKGAVTPQSPLGRDDRDPTNPASSRDYQNSGLNSNLPEGLFVSDDEGSLDQPPEDDLDALLAEDKTNASSGEKLKDSQYIAAHIRRENEDFDDEMEAMAGLDSAW